MSGSRAPKAQGPAGPDEDGLFPETPALRRLRLLVTMLTIVLIAGVLTVSVLLVIRLGSGGRASPVAGTLPEVVRLPEGMRAVAVGRGAPGELLIVVEGADGAQRLLAFEAETGAPLGAAELLPE